MLFDIMRGSIESLGMQGKQSFPKFANMGKSHINQTQPSNSPTQQNSGQKKCQPSSHLCQPSEQADSPSARAAPPHPQGRRLCHRKKIQEGGLFQFISGTWGILKSNFFGCTSGPKKGSRCEEIPDESMNLISCHQVLPTNKPHPS